MRYCFTPIVALLTTLAGCAGRPPSPFVDARFLTAPVDGANCTNVIGQNGGLLKFCQTATRLTVFESGLRPEEAAKLVSIVRNPDALKTLQVDLPLRRDLKVSRRIVAKSCNVAGNGYLTIAVADLKRMLHDAPLSTAGTQAW